MYIYSISSEKSDEQVLSLVSPEVIYNKKSDRRSCSLD
jgi:hypothetical protein